MFLYLYFVLIRKLNESTEASCNCLIFVWNLIKKKKKTSMVVLEQGCLKNVYA